MASDYLQRILVLKIQVRTIGFYQSNPTVVVCFSQYHVICFKYFHCDSSEPEPECPDEDWSWSRRHRNVGVNTGSSNEDDLPSISDIVRRMQEDYKKCETPPPPYDPPPPYNIAIFLGSLNEACVISEPVLV